MFAEVISATVSGSNPAQDDLLHDLPKNFLDLCKIGNLGEWGYWGQIRDHGVLGANQGPVKSGTCEIRDLRIQGPEGTRVKLGRLNQGPSG